MLSNLRDLLRPLLLRLAGLPPLSAEPAPPSVGGMPYGVAIALAAIALVLDRHT